MANSASTFRAYGFLFMLTCCLLVGILCGLASIPMWYLYGRSAHWDRVEVTVTRASRRPGKALVFNAAYDFTYAGRRWQGHRVVALNQSAPQEFVAMCQEQEDARQSGAHTTKELGQVLAWVNPADPSDSLLYRRIDTTMWGITLGGAALTGVPVLIGLLWWGRRRVRAARQRRASEGENVYADQRLGASDDR